MILSCKPQAILFDLDGTLAHTLPQLGLAVTKSMQQMGIKEPTSEEMSSYIGNGATMLLGRSILGRHDITLDEVPPEQLKEARRWFNKFYSEGLRENFEVYAGVIEGLKYFCSIEIKLGVVSNKPHIFTEPLIKFMGMQPYFSQVLGGEVLSARKPDPQPLYYVLQKLGVKPERALMVGDSINDVRAGENAHMTTVAFTYGYDGGYDLHTTCHPDYLFAQFSELTELIRSLPDSKA